RAAPRRLTARRDRRRRLLHVPAGASRGAHVLARQRVRPRRAAGVVRARRAHGWRRGALRGRTEARRSRDLLALRGGAPHARRDAAQPREDTRPAHRLWTTVVHPRTGPTVRS